MTASFVERLECARCGTTQDPGALANLCPSCAGPFLVRYDLARVRAAADRGSLGGRDQTMWRYRELLPIDGAPVTLGENMTPLQRLLDEHAKQAF